MKTTLSASLIILYVLLRQISEHVPCHQLRHTAIAWLKSVTGFMHIGKLKLVPLIQRIYFAFCEYL